MDSSSFDSFSSPAPSPFKTEPGLDPPLVRPVPSYPRVYPHLPPDAHRRLLDFPKNHAAAAYEPSVPRQTFAQFEQSPDPLSYSAVDPNDLSAWTHDGDSALPDPADPSSFPNKATHGHPYGFSDDSDAHQTQSLRVGATPARGPAGNNAPATTTTTSTGFDLARLPELPPPPSHPSHILSSSFAPHVFSTHHHHHRNSPSSASPSPMSHLHRLQDPQDQPWNLVPYNLPFTASSRTPGNNVAQVVNPVVNAPQQQQPQASAGPVNVAPNGPAQGLFLRSPTPTKRQRTNQACEKCRDRKAKCNGGRPSCARCLQRGLVCEYAKERRMRGPNKPHAGGNPPAVTPAGVLNNARQRVASSPARQQQPHPVVSVHISSGQGTSPPPGGGGSPPHRRHLTTSADSRRPSPNVPVPVYRTIHVAHSHPDLHGQAVTPPGMVRVQQDATRPRSHTTPYPLIIGSVPTHPSPLYNAIRSGGGNGNGDFSSSETSEPPSATSSTFGPIDIQNPYTVTSGMEVYADGSVGLHSGMEVMGLHGRTPDAMSVTPAHYMGGTSAGDAFSTYSDSPDSYKPRDFDDMGGGSGAETAHWTGNFNLNVNTALPAHLAAGGPTFSALSSTPSQPASASSNPSTSSPDPYGYSHVNATNVNRHSAGSFQDIAGWNAPPQQQQQGVGQYGSSPDAHHASTTTTSTLAQPQILLETHHPPQAYGIGDSNSPKQYGMTTYATWGDAYPRSQLDVAMQSPSAENDFRLWFNAEGPVEHQHHQQHQHHQHQHQAQGGATSAKGGSPSDSSVEGAANGAVRAVPVLEVRD